MMKFPLPSSPCKTSSPSAMRTRQGTRPNETTSSESATLAPATTTMDLPLTSTNNDTRGSPTSSGGSQVTPSPSDNGASLSQQSSKNGRRSKARFSFSQPNGAQNTDATLPLNLTFIEESRIRRNGEAASLVGSMTLQSLALEQNSVPNNMARKCPSPIHRRLFPDSAGAPELQQFMPSRMLNTPVASCTVTSASIITADANPITGRESNASTVISSPTPSAASSTPATPSTIASSSIPDQNQQNSDISGNTTSTFVLPPATAGSSRMMQDGDTSKRKHDEAEAPRKKKKHFPSRLLPSSVPITQSVIPREPLHRAAVAPQRVEETETQRYKKKVKKAFQNFQAIRNLLTESGTCSSFNGFIHLNGVEQLLIKCYSNIKRTVGSGPTPNNLSTRTLFLSHTDELMDQSDSTDELDDIEVDPPLSNSLAVTQATTTANTNGDVSSSLTAPGTNSQPAIVAPVSNFQTPESQAPKPTANRNPSTGNIGVNLFEITVPLIPLSLTNFASTSTTTTAGGSTSGNTASIPTARTPLIQPDHVAQAIQQITAAQELLSGSPSHEGSTQRIPDDAYASANNTAGTESESGIAANGRPALRTPDHISAARRIITVVRELQSEVANTKLVRPAITRDRDHVSEVINTVAQGLPQRNTNNEVPLGVGAGVRASPSNKAKPKSLAQVNNDLQQLTLSRLVQMGFGTGSEYSMKNLKRIVDQCKGSLDACLDILTKCRE